MTSLICLLWGHSIQTAGPILRLDGQYVLPFCRNCQWIGEFHNAAEIVPSRFKRRGGRWVTMGPLRRVWEYLSCQVLGHDEKWEPAINIWATRTVCQTCGMTGRLVRDDYH